MNTRRWQWGNAMARALLLVATFAGQWLGVGGKDAQAQERSVPPGDEAAKAEANLAAHSFHVPPTFWEDAGGVPADDLFASSEQKQAAQERRPTAVDILKNVGITFGEGCSAVYLPADSRLIVRNTRQQMAKVNDFVRSLRAVVSRLVLVEVQFANVEEDLFPRQAAAGTPDRKGMPVIALDEEDDPVAILSSGELRDFEKQRLPASGDVDLLAVLDPTELAALFDRIEQQSKGGVISKAQVLMANNGRDDPNSGKGAMLFTHEGRGLVVKEAIASFEDPQIHLALMLQTEKRKRPGLVLLNLKDGETVVTGMMDPDGNRVGYQFVTAFAVDPAGKRIYPAGGATELPKVKVVTTDSCEPDKGGDIEFSPLPPPGVVIEAEAVGNNLYTNVYQVPPTFLNHGGNFPADDPFASPEKKRSAQERRPTAIEILEEVGITFGEGCSAIYQAAGSQLIVRNTQHQMELVVVFIDSIKSSVEKQIYVQARFVETDEPLFENSPADRAAAKAKKRASAPTVAMKVASADEMASLLAEENVASAIRTRTPVVKPQMIATVLTEVEKQAALKEGAKRESWKDIDGGSEMFRSGQGATVLAHGNRGIGIVELVIGADEYTIELKLMVQGEPTKKRSDEREIGTTQATIWDGQTVVFSRRLPNGRFQYDLVTVRIKDPAGMSFNSDEKVEKNEQAVGGEAHVEEIEAAPEQTKAAVDPSAVSAEEAQKVRAADELALRAQKMMANEQYAQSRDLFLQALEVLPSLPPWTKDRETAYLEQFLAAVREAERHEN